MPVDLLPTISKLSHLDAHVFLVGCILGNRFHGELGLVPVTRLELSRLCGTTEYRLRQSIRRLRVLGLIDFQSSGWLFMTHYSEKGGSSGAPSAPQEHPRSTTGAPQEHFGCSSGAPQTEQLQLIVEDAAPLNGITKKGNNGRPKRRDASPKVVWDEEKRRLEPMDEAWRVEFREHWENRLGPERYEEEFVKANNWLANPERAKRRGRNSKLDRFIWNWMMRAGAE